jgi:hypothetical protein
MQPALPLPRPTSADRAPDEAAPSREKAGARTSGGLIHTGSATEGTGALAAEIGGLLATVRGVTALSCA